MDTKTFAKAAILRRIKEKVEQNNRFQDYSDNDYSDYSDDGDYGDSSSDWT